MKRDSSLVWRAIAVLGGVLFLALLGRMSPEVQRASVETVCVSLTVIGLDGGDPGNGDCEVTSAASESSSSVSVSSSSASSDASSSVSSQASSAASVSSVPGSTGPRRGTTEQSQSRIIEFIRAWEERRLRPAPPEEPALWYEDAVRFLRERGYIDDVQDLRLHESATRAETAKLVLTLSGGITPVDARHTQHFNDVLKRSWYFAPIEQSAENGWMLGYDNCYGTYPCFFRPTATITRAEAAAVIIRLLRLTPTYKAPFFGDVPSYAWYRDTVQTAADVCILQGYNGLVRPDGMVTRAELMVMVYRAMQRLEYGKDCGRALSSYSPDAFIRTMVSVDYPVLVTSTAMSLCPTTLQCVLSAVAADVRTFILHPFMGTLVFPAAQDLHAAAGTEPLGWGVALVVIILVILVLAFIIRHRFGIKRIAKR